MEKEKVRLFLAFMATLPLIAQKTLSMYSIAKAF
jgi:hypothetical protein